MKLNSKFITYQHKNDDEYNMLLLNELLGTETQATVIPTFEESKNDEVVELEEEEGDFTSEKAITGNLINALTDFVRDLGLQQDTDIDFDRNMVSVINQMITMRRRIFLEHDMPKRKEIRDATIELFAQINKSFKEIGTTKQMDLAEVFDNTYQIAPRPKMRIPTLHLGEKTTLNNEIMELKRQYVILEASANECQGKLARSEIQRTTNEEKYRETLNVIANARAGDPLSDIKTPVAQFAQVSSLKEEIIALKKQLDPARATQVINVAITEQALKNKFKETKSTVEVRMRVYLSENYDVYRFLYKVNDLTRKDYIVPRANVGRLLIVVIDEIMSSDIHRDEKMDKLDTIWGGTAEQLIKDYITSSTLKEYLKNNLGVPGMMDRFPVNETLEIELNEIIMNTNYSGQTYQYSDINKSNSKIFTVFISSAVDLLKLKYTPNMHHSTREDTQKNIDRNNLFIIKHFTAQNKNDRAGRPLRKKVRT